MNIKDIKNSQFKDKNILITGCSKGIGRSLVIKLSQLCLLYTSDAADD